MRYILTLLFALVSSSAMGQTIGLYFRDVPSETLSLEIRTSSSTVVTASLTAGTGSATAWYHVTNSALDTALGAAGNVAADFPAVVLKDGTTVIAGPIILHWSGTEVVNSDPFSIAPSVAELNARTLPTASYATAASISAIANDVLTALNADSAYVDLLADADSLNDVKLTTNRATALDRLPDNKPAVDASGNSAADVIEINTYATIDGYKPAQLLAVIASMAGGNITDSEDSTPKLRSLDNDLNRISSTVDQDGNRVNTINTTDIP